MGSFVPPLDVLGAIEAQCSRERIFSGLSVARILGDHFPDHLVIQVDKPTFDLPSFTGPGRAQLTLDEHTGHVTSVRYTRETPNVKNTGPLKANTLFAKYNYTWDGTDFVLFVLSPDVFGRRTEYHFLLTPHGTDIMEDGLHPKARELLLAAGEYARKNKNKALVFKDAYRSFRDEVDDEAWKPIRSSNLDDIILDADTKKKLTGEVKSFFTSRDQFDKFNLTWKREILFHGPSGTGKTIITKAMMAMLAEEEHPVLSMYVNFAEDAVIPSYNIQDMFSHARQIAPCLLVIENIDSFMTEHHRGAFLNELDSDDNDGILVIGSTQNLETLDPAIRARPGRFNLKYEFKLPDHNERLAFAKQWKSKLDESHLVELPEEACEYVANLTDGFSFTYLRDLFSSLLFYSQDAPTESEAKDSEEKDTSSSSPRQQAFAQVTTPPSLRDNHVAKFLRQQAGLLLKDMETEPDACPGCTRRAANAMKIASVVAPAVDAVGTDACPGCTRKIIGATTTALSNTATTTDGNGTDACPGCTRKAAKAAEIASNAVTTTDTAGTDACPGCTRKLKSATTAASPETATATDADGTDACPGCTRKAEETAIETAPNALIAAATDGTDACPGCTRKKEIAAATAVFRYCYTSSDTATTTDDDGTDACPGCTKKAENATSTDVATATDTDGTNACPGCTRKAESATETATSDIATATDTDGTDACPGCTRTKSLDATETEPSDAATDSDASTEACPGCTRKMTSNAVETSAEPSDVSTEACPGCT
ncbi:hypothetical protein PFICI_12499 [Pestalotiopsis fici W106-1]|uniref:AAA+ ATPase domain-containing protein n=1 Tax=Pestalotiopsis fici (strain W106-1 / CGMCC3.15140) TaxID=1229662 RepID=W3WNQ8_PESFW|nr:uncharacterized protein PFICI_12499 [Pestalotiopsis fici W106-1]ETS75555.1 hypothetical protein PFICI_12499 [Pestalotiopsis fici W106-1]